MKSNSESTLLTTLSEASKSGSLEKQSQKQLKTSAHFPWVIQEMENIKGKCTR